MEYVQQRGMGRQAPGVAIVIGVHVIVGYALVTGLARRVVEVIRQPIETKIIEEVKKPPPDVPPPPPPPKLQAPPPPFIPPPEIQIQAPPPPPQQTITTVTTTPAPALPAPAAAPVAPKAAPPAPAVRRNFAASHRVEPMYPARARARGIAGKVVAHVFVRPDGTVAEVRIVSATPPHVFDHDVEAALMQWKFNPEPAGFIGEYEINFQLKD